MSDALSSFQLKWRKNKRFQPKFWRLPKRRRPAKRRGTPARVVWTTSDGRQHSRRFATTTEARRFAAHLRSKR